MKHVIENRDINDPAETKEIECIGLDLEAFDEPEPAVPDFSAMIEAAIPGADRATEKERRRQKMREAQADFEAGQKALAEKIKADTGLAVGYQKGWVYEPKLKVAYALWKKVLPQFIERPETLDMGPTALAVWFAPNEPNFKITRDMFYDKLNKYSVADLKRLLRLHNIDLKLRPPVTIRSVQKELKEREVARSEVAVEKFTCRFEIKGDSAYVNGRPYKIQIGASGKPRIKRDGEWLSLDALRAFCKRAG